METLAEGLDEVVVFRKCKEKYVETAVLGIQKKDLLTYWMPILPKPSKKTGSSDVA